MEVLSDDENYTEKFVAYVEKLKEQLLKELEDDVARSRLRLTEKLEREIDGLVKFSDVVDKRAIDMVLNEDATIVATEWNQFRDSRRPYINIDIDGEFRSQTESINFKLKENSKYRVIVMVEKVGEFDPVEEVGLEFVGGR